MSEPTLEQVIENQQNVIELWAKKHAELEQRLADVEEELDELDKELFIFASDVIYSENEKIPNWLVDKARAIYYRPRLGKGE